MMNEAKAIAMEEGHHKYDFEWWRHNMEAHWGSWEPPNLEDMESSKGSGGNHIEIGVEEIQFGSGLLAEKNIKSYL